MDLDLYLQASHIIREANQKRASLKTLIYSSSFHNIRQLFALVSECVKYQEVLRQILNQCPDALWVEEPFRQGAEDLALVLFYEHLLGKNFGKSTNLRKLFQSYKSDIQGAVRDVLKSRGAKSLKEVIHDKRGYNHAKIPRYMRVNLIKSSVEVVLNTLQGEGWTYMDKLDGHSFVKAVGGALKEQHQFGRDPWLRDVLVFPPGTDLHDHPLTLAGILVQQDRASCVPAHVLDPNPGSVVMDCCAAPGNKTTHLASLMGDEGRVIALDRDAKRMQTLQSMVTASGARCVQLVLQDCLAVRPDSEDAESITHILVDPSCSGSGMLSQTDHQTDAARLQMLKRFQISILKHALRFPSVERVVYSTCSICQEENEEVVTEVMGQVSDYFQFEKALPEWGPASRGLEGFSGAECFLRLSPERDLTQGFFVACFTRKPGVVKPECTQSTAKVEEYLNKKIGTETLKRKKEHEASKSKPNVKKPGDEKLKKKKRKKHEDSEGPQQVEKCQDKQEGKKTVKRKPVKLDDISEVDCHDGQVSKACTEVTLHVINESGEESRKRKKSKRKKNKDGPPQMIALANGSSIVNTCIDDGSVGKPLSRKSKKRKMNS